MPDWLGLELYTALLVGTSVALFYYYVSGLRWNASERRAMQQAEMNLSVILDLLEGPSTQWLLASRPASRRRLFDSYSRGMKQDVLGLVRLRRLRFVTVGLVGAFFLTYYALRLKSLLYCGFRDVYVLSGMELAIFRSLQE